MQKLVKPDLKIQPISEYVIRRIKVLLERVWLTSCLMTLAVCLPNFCHSLARRFDFCLSSSRKQHRSLSSLLSFDRDTFSLVKSSISFKQDCNLSFKSIFFWCWPWNCQTKQLKILKLGFTKTEYAVPTSLLLLFKFKFNDFTLQLTDGRNQKNCPFLTQSQTFHSLAPKPFHDKSNSGWSLSLTVLE